VAANHTNYNDVIRELWPNRRLKNMAYDGSAFFAQCEKIEDFKFKKIHVNFKYGHAQARSHDFATAQAMSATESEKLEGFEITRVSDYAIWTVDGETLEATEGDDAAQIEALETETQGALEELSNNIAHDVWGGSTASGNSLRTRVDAAWTAGDAFFTCSPVSDANRINVGMTLVAAATETGAIRAGSMKVTKVNLTTGRIDTTAAINTLITGFADNDFIFVSGDAPNAGSRKCIDSVPAYIPVSDPSATLFNGVDRTVDIMRMSGVRMPTATPGSSAGSILEATKKLLARIRNVSGRRAKPKALFFNIEDLDNLDTELQSNRSYEKIDVPDADVGFEAIGFATPIGRVQAFGEQWVPRGQMWALDMRTWEFHSLKMVPWIIQHDGNKILRQGALDGIEGRARYRGNLTCTAPGWNGTSSIPT
jgi:hypothetical protein